MAEVHLSRAAYADLAEIDTYGVAQFGEGAADAYQDGLDRAFTRLAEFPESGEARPEYGTGLRCLVYASHRIFYLFDNGVVRIVRGLHHSRDVQQHIQP